MGGLELLTGWFNFMLTCSSWMWSQDSRGGVNVESKASMCSFLPLLPPQSIMADQHVTTQHCAAASSFHSLQRVRNTFFLPASCCFWVSLHLSSGERRTPGFGILVVENGCCHSCALTVILQVPVPLLPCSLCSQFAYIQEAETGCEAKGEAGMGTCRSSAKRRAGKSGAEKSPQRGAINRNAFCSFYFILTRDINAFNKWK